MKQFTALQYLKMDIASSYGMDKLNWEDRLAWFEEYEPVLEGMLPKAESPCLMKSGIEAYYLTLMGKPTTHLVSLDATASCLQLIGVITKDIKTCTASNVISTGNREDPYTLLNNTLSKILGYTTSRADAKQAVMTTCFGSVYEPQQLYGEHYPQFLKGMDEEFPLVSSYLRLTKSIWNPNALSHTWTLPDGHTASPMSRNKFNFQTTYQGETININYNVNGAKDKSVSLSANAIHSIDGYIVREMVKRCRELGFYILICHDCFRCHPIYANMMRQVYNDLLCELAQSQILCDIVFQITGNRGFIPDPHKGWHEAIRHNDYSLC